MVLIYYKDKNGNIVDFFIPPDTWTFEQANQEIENFNKLQNHTTEAYMEFFRDGSLGEYLVKKAVAQMPHMEGHSESYGIHITAAGADALERAAKLLEGVPGGIDKALNSAIHRATAHLQSASTKAVRERYAISAANIRADENVTVYCSHVNGVQARVNFAGRRIPLFRFDGASPARPTYDNSRWVRAEVDVLDKENGKFRMVHPGVMPYGHVLKSTSPKPFPNGFVARMGSTWHTGIFARMWGRTSRGKIEIREYYGPSVPQMLGHRLVAEKLAIGAMDSFEKNLDQYVYALLNGYIGVR